jgi:toxin ParE1/3/4
VPRLAVVRTPAAEEDLIDIWCSIALDSPRAADRVLDGIADRIGQLAVFPDIGPLRTDIASDARVLVEGNYLILYRHDGAMVEIVRVVHGARDPASLF